MEQSAYNKLKLSWPNVPDRSRKHCGDVARFAGPGSYSILESCIEMEADAASKNKGRSFKY